MQGWIKQNPSAVDKVGRSLEWVVPHIQGRISWPDNVTRAFEEEQAMCACSKGWRRAFFCTLIRAHMSKMRACRGSPSAREQRQLPEEREASPLTGHRRPLREPSHDQTQSRRCRAWQPVCAALHECRRWRRTQWHFDDAEGITTIIVVHLLLLRSSATEP